MNTSRHKGYTLIELLVSVAIFSIIVLLATGALFSLLSYTRLARAESVAMTNLSFAVESMTRVIRTGTEYVCPASATYNGEGGDCAGPTTGHSFSFLDTASNTYVSYVLYTPSGGNGQIAKCVPAATSYNSGCTFITDPSLNITNLAFYARGTKPFSTGDIQQPQVTIIIQGSINVLNAAPVSFSIESSATQRALDI